MAAQGNVRRTHAPEAGNLQTDNVHSSVPPLFRLASIIGPSDQQLLSAAALNILLYFSRLILSTLLLAQRNIIRRMTRSRSLVTPSERFPAILWKFDNLKNDQVATSNITLTKEWLITRISR